MTDTVMTFCCPHCGLIVQTHIRDIAPDTPIHCGVCCSVFTIVNPSFEKDTLCTTRVIKAGVNAK